MGISVADNFSYLGGKPLDGRIQYATLAAMKAMADATLYEGCEAYCVATDKYYQWKSSNTVDASTGKWREVEGGGGGETYNDFTGATSSTAGAHGLVPAPSAGDEGKVLFGNGAWGNIVMPSVDYSVLSNEAFIFSTTEKVVGQWTDGKPLYQKTLYADSDLSLNQWNAIPYNISNLDRFCQITGVYHRNDDSFFNLGGARSTEFISCVGVSGTNVIFYVNNDIGTLISDASITLRYTKTTDSPLSADEKYAGLLSDGTVVYKKTVSTGGSVPSGTTLIYRLALLNSTDVVYFTK